MKISRRGFLRAGSIPLLGLNLPEYLQSNPKRKKSVIFFHLLGGPSHIDTYDPKPDAPVEIRGNYEAIETNVPGVTFSELLSEQAKIADRLCIIKSFTHDNADHGGAQFLVLRGRESAVNFYPAFGAVWSYLQNGDNLFPYIFMGNRQSQIVHDIGNMGILKAKFRPKLIEKDPNGPDFKIGEFSLLSDVGEDRIASRQNILKVLDNLQRDNEIFDSFNNHQQRAFDVIINGRIARAFDINEEPEDLRNQYGRTDVGQRALLARRLIEVGVNFVTIEHFPPEQNNYGWDHHVDIFKWFPMAVTPYDQAVSTLILDLEKRGLLDDVLVIAFGEFGRTPKINENGGRDHWPRAGSVLLAGNGIPGGQIYGSTDKRGYEVRNPVHPADLLATIYKTIGYDPDTRIVDKNNRSHFISEGHPINIF